MTPQEYLEFTRTTAARTTSGISDEDWARYVRLGLISEVGEVAGQVKRIIRDDGGVLTPERREKLLDELGDVLWYWAQTADVQGIAITDEWPEAAPGLAYLIEGGDPDDLTQCTEWLAVDLGNYGSLRGPLAHLACILDSTLKGVAARNVAKLSGRVAAGTIHGEGDER